MNDLKRIAILFRLLPGYNEGVIRGLASYARPSKPWLFGFFENPDSHLLADFFPHAGVCCTTESSYAEAIRRLKFPIVNVGIEEMAPALPALGNDDLAIGRCAARHFLDRGFTSFGYFATRETASSNRRKSGFCSLLPADAALSIHHDGEADRWLRTLPKRTAIFAYNDSAAAFLADRCRALGIIIPEHLALAGADNTESLCLLSWPALSSVEVAAIRIGQIAGEMIDDLLSGRVPKSRLVPPVGMVIRHSSDLFAINDEHVSRALQFISEHAGDPIRVGDVMRAIPISRRALEIRFRALVGRSMLDEIQRVHLETAKRLLVTTDWPMPRVALSSGFNDVKRFTTVFHDLVGVTPSQYRRN